ncbi:MAG: hypothetical protein JW910_09680 [Anaerolineae bacterium]|nr:hypothetical protein [Anaerolineae bacterium]
MTWKYALWRLLCLLLVGSAAAAGGLSRIAAQGGNGLPALPAGQHVGIIYSDTSPEAAEVIGNAFSETLAAGVDAYELSIAWSDLEPQAGQIDTSTLTYLLDILASLDVTPYLSIETINTVNLTLPADLSGAGPSALADGLHFDDPALIERFGVVLDAVVPLMAAHDGFFIAVGNEIDPWLAAHPEEVEPFLAFVAAARTRVQQIDPQIGVGASVTFDAVADNVAWLGNLLATSDAAVYTYYPLNADYTVRSPSVVGGDVAQMVRAAGGLPVLLQEVGYPSGYLPEASNGSSADMQRQFVENMFDAVLAQPQIRFVSFFQLADWGDAVCSYFMEYYGVNEPRFGEYLCSLGLRAYSGEAKPAYDAFLAGVQRFGG